MGILSVLFGRTKLRKGDREKYFSIITAAISLEGRTDIRLTEKAGLVFNPATPLPITIKSFSIAIHHSN